MNETDAGASVTGWSRSDAPKTRPGVQLHQLLEAELGQRLLGRRGATAPRAAGRTERGQRATHSGHGHVMVPKVARFTDYDCLIAVVPVAGTSWTRAPAREASS